MVQDIHTWRSMKKVFACYYDPKATRHSMEFILEHGNFGVDLTEEWVHQQYNKTVLKEGRNHKKELLIRNIPQSVTKCDAFSVVKRFGEVKNIMLLLDTST